MSCEQDKLAANFCEMADRDISTPARRWVLEAKQKAFIRDYDVPYLAIQARTRVNDLRCLNQDELSVQGIFNCLQDNLGYDSAVGVMIDIVEVCRLNKCLSLRKQYRLDLPRSDEGLDEQGRYARLLVGTYYAMNAQEKERFKNDLAIQYEYDNEIKPENLFVSLVYDKLEEKETLKTVVERIPLEKKTVKRINKLFKDNGMTLS